MDIPDISSKNSNMLHADYIQKHYPDFFQYIQNKFPDTLTFVEKLHWFYNNLSEHPKCEVCGKETRFVSFARGYKKCCSSGCVGKSRTYREKAKQTCLDKYGVDNASKNSNVIQKIKSTTIERYGGQGNAVSEFLNQAKQTKLERYGDENYTNRDKSKQTCLERYGNEEIFNCENIQEKSRLTKLERYGDENYTNTDQTKQTCLERYGGQGNAVPEFLNQAKQTKLERYGDENYTNREKSKQTCLERYGAVGAASDLILEKINKTRRKSIINNHDFIEDIDDDGNWIIKCNHQNCQHCQEKTFTISRQSYYNRIYCNAEVCTKLNPINFDANTGTNVELFVRNILNNLHIDYECNNRAILNGKELDIYIPSHKLAIECNGVYWHSSEVVNNNKQHYNKWKECNSLGLQLLTLWEDQIINQPQIIESIICSKLGIYKKRIGARQCQIREVSAVECKQFLECNHLQGSINSKIRYGLYYNNELQSIMTFGMKRRCMGGRDEWELHRYCCKMGVQVIGGVKRLFMHFINTIHPTTIESFSSNDISNGDLYKKLGFEFYSNSISYWYIKNMKRYHRYSFSKHTLVAMGYDKNLSESQIMKENHYYKIFDSGQSKWIWK